MKDLSLSSRSMRRIIFLILSCCVTFTNAATERAGHIDLFDADTLSYYLQFNQSNKDNDASVKHPYDVVVLYYAQWCQNCRALSPIYIRIAELLKAGEAKSNILLGYFDCEANYEHAVLCEQAGITHYPTLQYISLAPDHRLPRTHKKLPPHVTQFPGNWQVGEAILDWIRTMSFLSQWHRASWGKALRNVLFKKSSSYPQASVSELPVGLPPQIANQKQLETTEQALNSTQALVTRTSYYVDALLAPLPCRDAHCMTESATKNVTYTDAYAYLDHTNGWSSMTPSAQIVRSCVLEAVLDVCQRLQVQIAEIWLSQQKPIPQVEYLTQEQLEQFEPETLQMMEEQEPYCLQIDQCIMKQLEPVEVCLPPTCPFQESYKCRYLTTCFVDAVQRDYADALGVEWKPYGSSEPTKKKQETKQQKQGEEQAPKKQKWGLF
jgi:thiol-disulfide isomerase/thioredoxin